MKTLLQVSIIALFITVASTTSAQTQSCAPYKSFTQYLFENFGEVPISRGIEFNGGVLEVLASASDSWTFLLVRTDGLACIVASGTAWEILPTPIFPQAPGLNKDEISL